MMNPELGLLALRQVQPAAQFAQTIREQALASQPAPQGMPAGLQSPGTPGFNPKAPDPRANVAAPVQGLLRRAGAALRPVGGLLQAADRAGGRLLNPTPKAYDPRLTPEEVEQARPGLMNTIFGEVGGGDPYTTRLMKMAQAKDAGRLQDARASIAAKYQPQENETRAQAIDRLARMYTDYAAANDFDMMKQTGEVLKSIGGEGTRPTLKEIETPEGLELVDPYTGETVRQILFPEGTRRPGLTQAQENAEVERRFRRENTLAQSFIGSTKEFAVVANQINVMNKAGPAALQGDPAAQLAMIFSFMKIVDPGSVVRESEQATAANARGVPEDVRNLFNRVRLGARLTPEQVQRFLTQGAQFSKGYEEKLENFESAFRKRAKDWGIDTSNVTINYFKNPRAAGLIGDAVEREKTASPMPGGGTGAMDYSVFFNP